MHVEVRRAAVARQLRERVEMSANDGLGALLQVQVERRDHTHAAIVNRLGAVLGLKQVAHIRYEVRSNQTGCVLMASRVLAGEM